MTFDILARSARSSARVGRLTTPHGSLGTPAFMPVGTRGSVKGLLPSLIAATGSQIVLANTYHLLLRPGSDLVSALGGLHRFMGWPGPILTDSGGYQAFSMADANQIDEDGVTFRSEVDGSNVRLTPEIATQVQNRLGADIIMAFDDCPPARDPEGGQDDGEYARRLRLAIERTRRWARRCVDAHERPAEQALFGIVQGGTDLVLREQSARDVCGLDLPGYAIGGVAVGEGPEQIQRVVVHTAALLPEDRPRYLMGVGYEADIVGAVLAGVDMFDCVLPTRNGRNATAFTAAGQIRLRNSRFRDDAGPIEAGCDCHACDPAAHAWATPGGVGGLGGGALSRAYIRHLFMAREMLGPILVSLHNVRYFQRLMLDIARTIREDDWLGLARRWPVVADVVRRRIGSGSDRHQPTGASDRSGQG